MPEGRKNHLKEILIGLFITVIGGILVVHYQEGLHKNKVEKGNGAKLTSPSTTKEIDSSMSSSLPYKKSDNKPTISQPVSPYDIGKVKNEKIIEENKPIEKNIITEGKGLSIKILDGITQRPVEGVLVNFTGFPYILTSNQNGDFIIPQSIISKQGEYNSVEASFTKSGFETVSYWIGLSEPQKFKINKLQ